MSHSVPREFIITFKDVSPAEGNQLAEELRVLLLREVGNAAELKRYKEDPTALDEGSALVIFLATVAVASVHSPDTMTEALLTAILVDFAYRHGVELQLEDKLGNAFQVAKDVPHAVLEGMKRRLQSFFQQD
jgi:hypothetical protein